MTDIKRISVDTSKSVFTLYAVNAVGSGYFAATCAANSSYRFLRSCRRLKW